MSRRNRAKVLTEIVRVRVVQERAAEMAVARSNTELHDLQGEEDIAQRQLDDDQDRWSTAMAAPTMDPALAGAWSAAVLQTQASVREVGVRIAQAQDRKGERSQTWRTALARADVARDLARTALRTQTRATDEAALSELSDRIAGKGQPR